MKYLFIFLTVFFLASCAIKNNQQQKTVKQIFLTHEQWGKVLAPMEKEKPKKWSKISLDETIPYHVEGIKSNLIYSYKTSNGSYIFTTVMTILKNKKIDNVFLHKSLDESFFNKTFELYSEPDKNIIYLNRNISGVNFNITGNGSGYELMNRKGIATLMDKTYIPISFKDKYYSVIILNYRGTQENKADFDDFLKYRNTLKLPKDVLPLN